MLIANHPYGILDGIGLGHILLEFHGSFYILGRKVFKSQKR